MTVRHLQSRRTHWPQTIGWIAFMLLVTMTASGCVRPIAEEKPPASNPQPNEPITAVEQTADPNRGNPEFAYPIDSNTDNPQESEDSQFFILHTVEDGDTLSTIAEQYEISMTEIMALNQIANSDFIYVGQTLRLPGPEFQSLVSPSFEIIPDSELIYGPAAKDFDLETFMNQSDSFLLSYMEEVEGSELSGPEIVQLVADRHSVNPKLLLAALEYQANWLSERQPAETLYIMGHVDEESSGLYKQLSWAANLLNWGFYGRAEGGITSFAINEEIPVSFAEDISYGTSGVQYFLATRDGINYEDWLVDVGATGLFDTYSRLFGDPFAQEIDPLVPADLSQPELNLPWANGETWYFTGGPHGGWNTGSAWAALDFVPPNQEAGCSPSESWTTAVADGVVSRSGHGAVVLDLDGDGYSGTGWAITYMHLDKRDRVPVGTSVRTGDPLGHPGCEGGFTNGTHVHLARTYNGRWISADGALPFNLNGWISQGEGFEYNGSLVRDGVIKTADIYHTENNAITAD
jgi:murein DD-endopeptidase MepM/ murein hydrolase activator NlpD